MIMIKTKKKIWDKYLIDGAGSDALNVVLRFSRNLNARSKLLRTLSPKVFLVRKHKRINAVSVVKVQQLPIVYQK